MTWQRWGVILGAIIMAFLAGMLVNGSRHDRALAALKEYGDSITAGAQRQDSTVQRYADSVQAVIDSLKARKAVIVHVATKDIATVAQLDTALSIALTLRDSNVV